MLIQERIRSAIDASGLNLKEFCERANVNYRTAQHYLSGERGVSADFLAALTERMGISSNWILSGVGQMLITNERRPIGHSPSDIMKIQRDAHTSLGDDELSTYLTLPGYTVEASAGHGAFAGVEARYDVMAVHRDWIAKRGLKADALCLISVKGDSMAPALIDGELIMLDRSQTALRHGAIFVVSYSDALFVKRIQQLPGNRLQLLSSNPDYPPIVIDGSESDQVKVVGRVVASMREW